MADFEQSDQKVRDQININNPGTLIGGAVVLGIVGIVVFGIASVTGGGDRDAVTVGATPGAQASPSASPSAPPTAPPSGAPSAAASSAGVVAQGAPPASTSSAGPSGQPICGGTHPSSTLATVKDSVCYAAEAGKYTLVAEVSAATPTLVDVYVWVSTEPGNVYAYPAGGPRMWRVKVGPDKQEFRLPIDMGLTSGRSYGVHVWTGKAGGPPPPAATNAEVTGHSLMFKR
ncbi:hypothetical protein [Streptomyces bambusae]|uniref:Uncharacterized protein n=1 Tax=Streptomyces bambusae TaxID=1550616 RepID=A0ABS6ZBF9_9ACTN|nr:hypothetical protein [Streptomyces bambusae]MBW5484041.1 hypothetical protein [Streptomyces bambusae]